MSFYSNHQEGWHHAIGLHQMQSHFDSCREVLTMRAALCGLLVIASADAAWAINKCSLPDGRVVYQDATCAGETKNSEQVKTWNTSAISGSRSDTWRFERKVDDMTGKLSCLAISPLTFPKPSGTSKFIPVHAVLAVTPARELMGIRTSTDSDLFHNDLSGMGVKADKGQFVPLTIKASSHVVGVSDDKALIVDLEKSQNLLVRARFWPYDQLHDMEPIRLTGFAAALKQARSCAGAGG